MELPKEEIPPEETPETEVPEGRMTAGTRTGIRRNPRRRKVPMTDGRKNGKTKKKKRKERKQTWKVFNEGSFSRMDLTGPIGGHCNHLRPSGRRPAVKGALVTGCILALILFLALFFRDGNGLQRLESLFGETPSAVTRILPKERELVSTRLKDYHNPYLRTAHPIQKRVPSDTEPSSGSENWMNTAVLPGPISACRRTRNRGTTERNGTNTSMWIRPAGRILRSMATGPTTGAISLDTSSAD